MEQTEERVDSTIGGVPISIRGLNMVVFLALVGVTGYMIWFLSIKVSDEHRTISQSIERQNEIMEEQNYILLADEQETKDIKRRMKMPRSLKAKLEN